MRDYVFLGTEVYCKNKYKLSHSIELLKNHIEKNDSLLLIHSIVRQEIFKNIEQEVRTSINQLKAHTNNVSWFCEHEPKLNALFGEKSSINDLKQKIINSIFNKLENDFLYSCIEVKFDNVNAEDIFSDYFSELPPFKNYKEEFKDAFIAYSLLKWAQFNQVNKISIISGNKKDWKPICERDDFCKVFRYYQDIGEYLADVIRREIEEAKAKAKAFLRIKKAIMEQGPNKIKSEFENIWFTLPSELWSDDENDPVLKGNSILVNIDEDSICIVDSNDEYNEVSFTGDIEYNLLIDTADPDSGMSMGDDINYYYDRIEGVIKARHFFSSYATLYTHNDSYIVEDINHDLPKSIEAPWNYEYNQSTDEFIDFKSYIDAEDSEEE